MYINPVQVALVFQCLVVLLERNASSMNSMSHIPLMFAGYNEC